METPLHGIPPASTVGSVIFDPADPGPDYELVWPRALFAAEAAAILKLLGSGWTERAELLLEEAFAGIAAGDDLRVASWQDFPDQFTAPWGGSGDAAARAFLRMVLVAADALPEQAAPRPYYAHRQGRALPTGSADVRSRVNHGQDPAEELQRDWKRLVDDLQDRGYLDRAASRSCVDDPAPGADEVLDAEVEQRLALAALWHVQPGQ